MGTQHLHDFLLATSITAAFNRVPEPLMDLNRFWTRSIRCAILTRLLAIECRVLESERLFVAGLLSDIGHLVMFQLMPEQTAEAEACAEAQSRPLAEVERDLFFGFDYAEVGSLLLKRWNLPAMLSETVRHHNEPDKAQKFSFETTIVHVGRIIGATIEKSDKAADALALIAPSALQQTGLTEEKLSSMETKTHRQLAETMALLLPGVRRAS
jgi:HD-like signal output (HDOD) protein